MGNFGKGEKVENKELSVKSQPKTFFKDLRNHAKAVLETLKNTEFKNNTRDGKDVIAKISREGIDKMISPSAVNKSMQNGFSKEQHFAAAENIGSLFEKAVYQNSEMPKNKSADIVAWHKYNADFLLDDRVSKVKITLKESVEAGHKIYSVELLEIIG